MNKEDKTEQDKENVSMYSAEFGRPRTQEKVMPSPNPCSLEIELLVREAVEYKDFRVAFVADPLQAAKSIGIKLDEAEKTMLRTITSDQLETIIELTPRFGLGRPSKIEFESAGIRPG